MNKIMKTYINKITDEIIRLQLVSGLADEQLHWQQVSDISYG